MKELNKILTEIGISKVKLAKFLGVSRQMLYNYLAEESIEDWPKEKSAKLFTLLGVKNSSDIANIKIDGQYIMSIENKIEANDKEVNKEYSVNLKGFNRKEQELLSDIFTTLQQKLEDDKSKDMYKTLQYLNNYLKSMENNKELKYTLAYFSKSMGFTDPLEFIYNESQQFIYESIMFSGMTLYNNGGASKTKIAETHKRFVKEIEHKKEERLSRTQELNAAKIQALRELGYQEINGENAKEVLDKIAEIQARNAI